MLLSPDGAIAAVYLKIHLFDVDLAAQGGRRYRESERIAPGAEVVVADTPFGVVGLSVCYDLRFPEMYRAQSARGARLLCVPSAFARETGRDHWEVLLRARAIENQCFVIAPAQWGQHSPERASHGRALVVDPWGVLLGVAPDRPAVVLADCDLAQQDRIRAETRSPSTTSPACTTSSSRAPHSCRPACAPTASSWASGITTAIRCPNSSALDPLTWRISWPVCSRRMTGCR